MVLADFNFSTPLLMGKAARLHKIRDDLVTVAKLTGQDNVMVEWLLRGSIPLTPLTFIYSLNIYQP